jgi:hypothetical protein
LLATTTLWHFDAAEQGPSTPSELDFGSYGAADCPREYSTLTRFPGSRHELRRVGQPSG